MHDIIEELVLEHPEVEKFKNGFPNIGKREDKEEFGSAVSSIEEAWHFYDTDLYNLNSNHVVVKLGSGNPVYSEPFPLAIESLVKKLNYPLYEYPPAAGNEEQRSTISKYLISEGYPKNINYNNVIITNSTTEGFYLILKSIFRPYDVILMTAPNYGLFAFMPERLNISVELIPLRKENNYKINPIEFKNRLEEINNILKTKYNNLNYVPKVRAFLNINPHNPLGTVLSKKDNKLLNEIGCICQDNNIFIIDDLIYRDLSYDRANLAKPIGTIHKYFNNTISLFGLSKSYGLAQTRSGFICANEVVIRLLRDNLFYIMDSASILQSSLLAGTYQNTERRNNIYKEYFYKVIHKYLYNLHLCKAIIDGIDSINTTPYYEEVLSDLSRYFTHDELLKILKGMKGAKTILEPESGFFILVDFTELKNNGIINTEKELLTFFYEKCGVKFLVGQSFSWPNKDELVARITYSFEPEVLIKTLGEMSLTLRGGFYETDRSNIKSLTKLRRGK